MRRVTLGRGGTGRGRVPPSGGHPVTRSTPVNKKEMEEKMRQAALESKAGPSIQELARVAGTLEAEDAEFEGKGTDPVKPEESSEEEDGFISRIKGKVPPGLTWHVIPQEYKYDSERPPPGWGGTPEEWQVNLERGNYGERDGKVVSYPLFEPPRTSVVKRSHLDSIGSVGSDDFKSSGSTFLELSIRDLGLSENQEAALGVLIDQIVAFSSIPGGRPVSTLENHTITISREVIASLPVPVQLAPPPPPTPFHAVPKPRVSQPCDQPTGDHGVEVQVKRTGLWERFPMSDLTGNPKDIWMVEMRKKSMSVIAVKKYNSATARFY